MPEDVLLACHTCGKQRNIELDQARQYNKENPYNCFDCSIIPETPKEEDQSRLSLIETNTDLGQASSPLGNLLESHQRIESYRIQPTIYHDPDVNAEIQRTSAIFPQRGEIFRDPIQAQTEYAKQKLEEFRRKREIIDRQLAREQERIDNYDHGNHGFSIISILLPIIIMIPVMLLMITGLISTLSSTSDCTNLNGNAEIHQTEKNATGLALQCLKTKDNLQFIIGIIPLLIIIPLFFIVLRILT